MSKLALSFSLIIVGVLLVGIIVSASIRYRSHKSGDGDNKNSVNNSINNSVKNTVNNSSKITNFARLNSENSYNSLSKSLHNQRFSSPYISSVNNNDTYGYYRGGDSLSGCSVCV